MPEGHTIHRAAIDHNRILASQNLTVLSPQGRFAEGASLINGKHCLAVEAFGKHLLYRFFDGDALHIHLGLFGKIRKKKLPLLEPRGAVRVRLIGSTHFVDINGTTICRLLGEQEVIKLIAVGPDVLRSVQTLTKHSKNYKK